MSNTIRILAAFTLFFSLTGCAEQRIESIKGIVLLDGQPTQDLRVILLPRTNLELDAYYSTTGEDGTFEIEVDSKIGPGEPGSFAVTIKSLTIPMQAASMPQWHDRIHRLMEVSRRFPRQYGSPKTTPLTIEVGTGVNELRPFELASESH